MSKVIRIPNDLHQRLASYAEGFDTPANVIERILNQYEHAEPEMADNDDVVQVAEPSAPIVEIAPPSFADIEIMPETDEQFQPEAPLLDAPLPAAPLEEVAKPSALLPITLRPDSEERFKKELLKIKKAKIRIFYQDGTNVDKTWNAFKFDSDSNVMTNLRSRDEFRQDVWQKDGITHAEVSIDYTL